MQRPLDIIQCIESPRIFKPLFKDLATWKSWLVLLRAFFALPMDEEDKALFLKYSGRTELPKEEMKELWAIVGRRGGKSWMISIVAMYLALFSDFSPYLSKGERAVILVIASDKAQSGIIHGYCRAILKSNPIFAAMVTKELVESLELNNGISLEVMTCSYRSVRGRTVCAAILDESAFFLSEGYRTDSALLAAIRPALSTLPNSKLLVISSPYAQRGILFDAYKRYYGKNDPQVLVWQAPTFIMNPNLSEKWINQEIEKDPASGRSEWLAEFRADISSFLSPDAVDAIVRLDGTLSPRPSYQYRAFVDSSGGGGSDSFSLCVGHKESGVIVCDLITSWSPPFDPYHVIKEISAILKSYHIVTVSGDKYAGGYTPSAFASEGITYRYSDKAKSELYLSMEGIVNNCGVHIPKNDALISELKLLERRTSKGGRDSVDHPPRLHDDLANALAGMVHMMISTTGSVFEGCDLS